MLDSLQKDFDWKNTFFRCRRKATVQDLTLANLEYSEVLILRIITNIFQYSKLKKIRLIKIASVTDRTLDIIGDFDKVGFYVMLFALPNVTAMGIENLRSKLHYSSILVAYSCCEQSKECSIPWTRWPTWDQSDLAEMFSNHYRGVDEDLESFYSGPIFSETELEPVDINDAEPWHSMYETA
jgi:hypothetical protein